MAKFKTALEYIIKSGIVFALLYFTFIEFLSVLSDLFFGLVLGLGFFGLALWAAALLGIIFLLSKFPKRDTSGEGVFRRHFMRPIIIAAGTGVMFILYFIAMQLSEVGETASIKRDISNAEALFQYRMSTYHMSGIKGVDAIHSLIIVDYDEPKVSFLIETHHDYEVFRLKSGAHTCGGNVQTEIGLPAPASKLITYYPDSDYPDDPDSLSHRTCAVELIMEDGAVYSLSDIKQKDTDFPGWVGLTPYEDFAFVEDKDYSVSHKEGHNPFA
ncbi:MAG: hypothetical protein K2G87_08065 [Oscillospiraceae bacterium]|nr:hypothetical protein [Oscillospiraceae bacterium]